ncbi:restriction endonuclease subunit S [Methanosarcina hadiensis]|uniref:restriction endonuclease subunit S n=1 Tax=Methanosarcina hadiensis TaxID=3078083 RepID=UPI0039773525
MASETKFKETEIGMIPEEWYSTTLGSLVTFQRGHDLTFENKVEGPYPIVSSSGILGYHNEYKIKGPGVTVGRSGNSLGKAFFVSEDYWPHNTILYAKKFHNVDPKFSYYLLKNLNLKEYNSGSAVPTLNRNYIHPIPVIVPKKLEEQKAISYVLSDLDEKIDLNNQMNKTLEQIAQTLFKRWFIDFEFPDDNGNPYKSSGGRMVDSELGEIPEGWGVGNILDYADLLSGGTPKTSISEYWDGGIPWVSAKDVTSSNGTFILTTERTITHKGIEKSNAKLLPKLTTVVTARGTVGNVCILSKEMAINQTNYGLKSKHDHGDFFLFITLLNLIQDMKQNAYGTVFDTITTKTFRQIQIILPPMKFIVSFDSIVGDLMHKVMSNLEESQNLSLIRDSLLPKLMSGKIRV